MEHRSELKRNSSDQKQLRTFAKTTLPQLSQRIDLQNRFKVEKPNLSYADVHHEITRNAKDISPKSLRNHGKQQTDRKGNEEDELVKYMSKLPNYLERGKNRQEKVLNVGVLDWGRLEKWQYSQKQMLHVGGRSCLSCSNLSSPSSSDVSSSHSSRMYISSPPHQKMSCPSPMSSHVEGHSQVVKSFGQSVERFHDLKNAKINSLNEQNKFIGTEFDKAHLEINIKREECKGKDSDPKFGQESGTLPNGVKCDIASTTKVEMKTEDGRYTKRAGKLEEGSADVANQDVSGIKETVLLLPTDLCRSNDPRATNISNSTIILGQKPAETRRRSLSERSKNADLSCEVDNSKHLQMKLSGSIDEKIDNSSKRSCSVPRSTKVGICPSVGGIPDDRTLATTVSKLSANEPLIGSDLKASKIASEKVRSTSPFPRLSFSTSKMGKSYGLKEDSVLPQSNTTSVSAQSGTEKGVGSSGLSTSNIDKSNATSKARSSPLRRLLDPILKSKPTNCHNNMEPLPRDLTSKDRASKSSDGRSSYSFTVAAQSGKVKLDMTGCRTFSVDDSFQEKNHGSPTVQGLLRVAVKNWQPLFTFAVDNESDILAATLKKSSASRKDCSCIYTFFIIQEVKKKNGRWLNKGGKGQKHDYIPNVVAQMKVSCSYSSNLIKENHVDQYSVREFALSSLELRQVDQQTSDFQPNEELAAIVVNIPMRITGSSFRDGYQSDMHKDQSELGLRDYLPEVTFDPNSETKVQKHPSIISQDIGATVILPSSVHALPHKGEPSSLVQRWRSGGSCDCGGWDLGCKLRILANWNQLIKKAGSSKASSTSSQFELFYQGGTQENQPFFSLAQFKDGIYSVEFNSSLSLLQAFSICIAVLDSKKACKFPETSKLFEEKASRETILVQNDGKKGS